MLRLTRQNANGSARTQVNMKEVKDGIIVLPGNRYRCVLATSSLNFELQSEEEQDVIIDTFQSFLNSLTRPLQILIRTRELDVDRYLEELIASRADETKGIYKKQLQNYGNFIKKLVAGNKILTRKFYLVIPYENNNVSDFDIAKEQLLLEQEIIIKNLEKLGMTAKALNSLEILDLFYNFYCPEKAKIQPLADALVRQTNDETIL